MRLLLPAVGLLALVVPARAQTYHATDPASITVQVGPEGLVVHQRSVRYEAYADVPEDIRVGVPFGNRLATIATVASGALDDQTSRVEVVVQALSGPGLYRVTAFSDPGSEGAVAAPFFVTTQRGCCSPLTRYHVRAIETGRLLFTATGAGLSGLVAVMDVPNRHPAVERWAAFEGRPGERSDPAMLGILRYGDRGGALDTLVLRMEVARQPEDVGLDLPECGALLWREPGREPPPGQPHRAAAGACFEPPGLSYATPLFGLEHAGAAPGGFELELSLHDTVYASIPVTRDRLDVAHARLAPGVSLAPVPQATPGAATVP